MTKKMICIVCPIGCHLEASQESGSDSITVTGNRCPRGEVYAKSELTDPRRTVTATVQTNSSVRPRLPVRTDQPLSRHLIPELLENLYQQQVKVPVAVGDILVKNIADTGVNVIFCDQAEN